MTMNDWQGLLDAIVDRDIRLGRMKFIDVRIIYIRLK
jgi:hypothetical protein